MRWRLRSSWTTSPPVAAREDLSDFPWLWLAWLAGCVDMLIMLTMLPPGAHWDVKIDELPPWGAE